MTVRTNAPCAYDYGYCMQVSAWFPWSLEGSSRIFEVRDVRIPEGYVEYQVGRYQSGLYLAIVL